MRTSVRIVAPLMALLISLASFSGCLGDEKEVDGQIDESEDGFGSFSVVAPIDTGINVYHDHFSMNASCLLYTSDAADE